MKRSDIEKIIADLNGRASQLIEDNAKFREKIHDNDVELVRIEAAVNEYYEMLEEAL